jgi:flagellar basal-body rod protein FlgF
MIYGLYLSASGVLTNSYRQDVIANNIANSETVGFKKDLALLQARPTAAQETGQYGETNSLLEPVGGGLLAANTLVDSSPGEIESTGNNFDVALQGKGFLAVRHNGQTHLTRNGQMILNRSGQLALSNDPNQIFLDARQKPISLDGTMPATISTDGTITQNGKAVDRLGLFSIADVTQLSKEGGTLLGLPATGGQLQAAKPTVRSGFIERSNVDPAIELTQLMDTQRQLEANANMMHIQDETLDKLVNDVGRVS